MEKFKKIFQNKERRVENLIVFLVILVITLIVINKIIKEDSNKNKDFENSVGVEFAVFDKNVNDSSSSDLEKRLESILTKIEGIGEVSVLITYSESSSTIPMYNVSSSISTTEEKDTSGGTRTIESQDNSKDIVTDSGSNPITEKTTMPVVEGAIVTAQGASNIETKANIIAAVQAVTGIATHKIQVFEMGDK